MKTQELIISKLKDKYEKEKEEHQKFIDKGFFANKEAYDKALSNFKVDFNSLNINKKRIFIDLLVDQIVVESNGDFLDVNFILNPTPIL